jgi:AmiR/NasT family two-component response regulator
VAAIVVLSAVSPSKLASELELFGHEVWEALDVSEVLFLCEQHRVDAVVIAFEVEHGEMIEKQLRGTVMRLGRNANAAYVDWELSQLFPKKDRIQ